MSAASIRQARFRAGLLGVLVGDCYGAPFERSRVSPASLLQQLERLNNLTFTDDTALTLATCRSFIANNGLQPNHLAREYTETFFSQPNRGYGAAIRQVFAALRNSDYQDPYKPATDQFGGQGSFGNGAAMRCNPIALFAHASQLDDKQTLDLVQKCSRITHSHIYGVNGAILLVTAIRYLLNLEPDTFSETEFVDFLIKRMAEIEPPNDPVFTNKLKCIKQVIEQLAVSGVDTSQAELVKMLGNDVSAQGSVPLAIYSFIRGVSMFTDSYRIDNEFMRTLHWAISCDGDTDTIASMACGLSGAYLGMSNIPEKLYKNCESWQTMIQMADKLSGSYVEP